MFKLPAKQSKKWFYISLSLFLMTFISLIIVSQILSINIELENIGGFILLSFFTAITISVGGYIGADVYFVIAFVFYILGLIYMFYVSITKTAEGWSDLVSIISFLITIGLGVLLGIVGQSLRFILLKNKHQ